MLSGRITSTICKVLGPTVMAALCQQIRGCPSPLEIPDGGHFVQEWGKEIAEAAVTAFA